MTENNLNIEFNDQNDNKESTSEIYPLENDGTLATLENTLALKKNTRVVIISMIVAVVVAVVSSFLNKEPYQPVDDSSVEQLEKHSKPSVTDETVVIEKPQAVPIPSDKTVVIEKPRVVPNPSDKTVVIDNPPVKLKRTDFIIISTDHNSKIFAQHLVKNLYHLGIKATLGDPQQEQPTISIKSQIITPEPMDGEYHTNINYSVSLNKPYANLHKFSVHGESILSAKDAEELAMNEVPPTFDINKLVSNFKLEQYNNKER